MNGVVGAEAMCEGWSLEIGNAFRGAVVRQDRIDQPPSWLASVTRHHLPERRFRFIVQIE